MAKKLAALAPIVHHVHQDIVRLVLDDPALHSLTPAHQALAGSPFDTEDFPEGWRAFLEKRQPRCQGR